MSARSGAGPGARRRVRILVVLCAWLAALGVVTTCATASAALALPTTRSASAAAATASLSVRLTALTPAVAAPGRPVVLSATVRNTSTRAVTGLRVTARTGSSATLTTREQIRRWAAGAGTTTDPVVGTTPVTGTLAPGAQVLVTVQVPATVVPASRAYGVLPLTVVASGVRADTGNGTSGTAAVSATRASFLPFHVRKEYEPLAVGFAVPLTADPDTDLVTTTGTARTQAWQRELGAGSRLDRVVDATSSTSGAPLPPVTWAIDPTIVGAHPTGDAAAPTAPSATPDAAAPQAAFARRLAPLASGRDIWALPPADPDIAALTRSSMDLTTLHKIVGTAAPLAQRLGLFGVARVAWPVGSPLRSAERAALDSAYGGTGPAAYVAPGSALDPDPSITGTAARRTDAGRPLLAFDDELSRLFTESPAAGANGERTERFLAESVALLAQSPGRRRSSLVVAGRTFDPQPADTRALLAAVAQAPWLSTHRTSDLITSASDPDSPVATTYRDSADVTSAGGSPLTPEAVSGISSSQAAIDGLAQVLSATPASTLVPDTATMRSLTSTRWRGASRAWSRADTTVRTRLSTLTNGVSVVPSTVNFFADHGVLQVTVVNNLDVEVHDVRLVVDPQGRPPRLRLTRTPPTLRISPSSRTTVRLDVEAVAAGVVPVATHLTTPSGTRLGTDATVRVRVRPTNGWVLLALGGLIGAVFLAGLYRALRAGSPRVCAEDLKEIDLE